VGGSNVFYHVGKAWIVPLGAFELFAKGAGPVWIGHYVLDLGFDSYVLMGAGLVAVAGHNWSVYLKFTGGRGVAVAIGVMLALAWPVLALFAAVGAIGWLIFRSSGVVVFVSLLLTPVWAWVLGKPTSVIVLTLGMIGLISLKRLLSNFTPPPAGVPVWSVLLNRLFRDRDIEVRKDWVSRKPQEAGPEGQ
jgi:glycerol-3-phosphate acyltransferase PlsY